MQGPITFNAEQAQERAQELGLENKAVHILSEIISTEISYINSLGQLDDNTVKTCEALYKRQKIGPNDLTLKQFQSLVKGLRAVRQANLELLNSLRTDDPSSWNGKISQLQDAYTKYAQVFDPTKDIPTEISKILSSNNKGLDLSSIFIMPIQRPPRYALLFQELLKAIHDNSINESVNNCLTAGVNLAVAVDAAYERIASTETVGNPLATAPNLPIRTPEQEQKLQKTIENLLKDLIFQINFIKQDIQDPQIASKLEFITGTLENLPDKSAADQKVLFDLIIDQLIPQYFGNMPDPALRNKITELVSTCKNQIEYNQTRHAEWIKNIRSYDIALQAEMRAGQPLSIHPYEDKFRVESILTTQESKDALYEGAYSSTNEPTTARKAFLKFLDERMLVLQSQTTKPRPKITMEVLLGTEGLSRYKAAIAEEGKSRAFRDAVFLKSFKHNEGAELDKRALLWVGGPSASGKTYAAEEVFKSICAVAPKRFDSLKKDLIAECTNLIKDNMRFKREILFVINSLETLSLENSNEEIQQSIESLQKGLKHLFKSDPKLTKQISDLIENAKAPLIQSLVKGNDTIQVDGGIEREVSQMRQMVLEVALARGYCGISDLHSNTKFDTKEHVKRAALAQPGLNVVIPETFAESMLLKRFAPEGPYKQNEMRTYEQRDDIEQYFSEIIAEEGQEQRFQTSVGLMGESRAYLDENEEFTEFDIAMNNRDLPCESKAYSSNGFWFGQMATAQARENFRKMNPEGWHIKVTNDLIFVELKNGKWQECGPHDKPLMKLSNRDFTRWQVSKNKGKTELDLPAWFENERKNKNLARPLVQLLPNDLMEVNTMEEALGTINISTRDFNRWFEEVQKAPNSVPPLMQWCRDQYQSGNLITPAEILFLPIVRKRSRINSAPTPLESVPADDFKVRIQMPRSHSLGDVREYQNPAFEPSKAANQEWQNKNVSDRAIKEMLVKLESEERKLKESNESAIEQMATVHENRFSREDEFKNAKAILEQALAENPQMTSFKINRKSHSSELDHSFICLRNKDGGFELYRMAADVLGKGAEGKFKIIDTEDGTEFGVKISAAKASKDTQKSDDDELQMMEDVGLLIGQFTVARKEKHDKSLNKVIGDKSYVIQPYIRGQELAKLMESNTLDTEQKLIMLREILANLKQIHDLGIIHRDIKPENIIVTLDSKGNVRDCTIIDYGVSFRARLGDSVVRSYAGTPAYMPPELGRNEFKKEFGEYLKLSNEMSKLQERKTLLTKGKKAPIVGLERLNNQISQLQRRIDEQKTKYMAVLKKEYSFTSSVDTYAVGTIADKLGLNLSEHGLEGLLSESPTERMSASDALAKVQDQISVMHAATLVDSPTSSSNGTTEQAKPSPSSSTLPSRLPSKVNPTHLNEIDGKRLLVTPEQMTKLKKFQARKQRGLFQIDDKFFLIDNNLRLYAIYQPLAKGGQGSVSLGQDLATGNWVAIKQSGDRVRREPTPYVVKVLERENQILQELGQLVGVVSAVSGQVSNRQEVHALSIQPFAFGEEYFDVARDNDKIPPDQAVLMSLRLFEELDKLHQSGILHLDIKPENVKWDSETNSCRILDMGTAITKEQQQEPLLYQSMELIGTPEYRPPELNQEMKPYSNKMDVYAAAKSLKRLLDKTEGLSESERRQIDDFIKKSMSDDPAARPTAAQAKVFFNQIAIKMQQEKRLVDVGISMQIAQNELSAFVATSENKLNKEALNRGVSVFLQTSHQNMDLQDKIGIAREVLAKLNDLHIDAEFNEGHFSEYHFLALAQILIDARTQNIENINMQLEYILKKPSDQLALQFAPSQKETQTLTSTQEDKENVKPPHPNTGTERPAAMTDAYKSKVKQQSSTAQAADTNALTQEQQQTKKLDSSYSPSRKK